MAPLLADVVAHLERKSVPAALIGAAALSSYGVARATFDADLVTVSRDVLVPGFWESFPAEVDIRRGDFDDPLAGVVRIQRSNDRQVDVIVSKYKYVRDIVERAESRMIARLELPVVRLADLVLLKLDAGGTQDCWDIERVLDQASPELIAEVEQLLPNLPEDARTLWSRIRTARA
jgi:predicted nucleotidyltransferase